MDQIVECVPNFSEGRNMEAIKKITDVIERVPGVKLVDVDPGADTNRTVVTFIGTPEGVVEAAFQAIKKAAEVIDMRKHKGAHPRHGATDVCPLVPVSGISMDECVELAKSLGKRVGDELGIPVYLYEYAARKEEWRSLANVRKGEYEALPEKLGTEEWRPDFGPNEWNERVAKTGVVTIGAREFLIAYNVNLNTKDKKLANDIALEIREAGRKLRGPDGRFVRDEDGNVVMKPGLLKGVRAIGWYIDDYDTAQISINLTNYKLTPLWKVFDTCVEEAGKRGLRVTGSEIVGLVPKEALLECGRHYLRKQNRCPGVPEEELINVAVRSLGLNELYPFEAEKKIVEYQIPKNERLVNMSVRGFVNEVSMPSQAPGGGSVAALSGALGAALAAMVPNLTKPKRYVDNRRKEDYDALWSAAERAQELMRGLLEAVDRDTEAFNKVIEAMRMPSNTPEEREAKERALEDGYKHAANVPMETMRLCYGILEHAETAAEKGLEASVSDAGVAAIMALAGLRAAALNVLINLGNIKDKDFNARIKAEVERMMGDGEAHTEAILKLVEQSIG